MHICTCTYADVHAQILNLHIYICCRTSRKDNILQYASFERCNSTICPSTILALVSQSEFGRPLEGLRVVGRELGDGHHRPVEAAVQVKLASGESGVLVAELQLLREVPRQPR
jgi:hypothetical protein